MIIYNRIIRRSNMKIINDELILKTLSIEEVLTYVRNKMCEHYFNLEDNISIEFYCSKGALRIRVYENNHDLG